MKNPYEKVDWENVQKVVSISHAHSYPTNAHPEVDPPFPLFYLRNIINGGVQHICVSNYYPSHPFYPLEDFYLGTEELLTGKLQSPNAEHHRVTNPGWDGKFHFNGLGSLWASGNKSGVTPVGVNMTWQEAFDNIFNNLLYPDGGGITINHPEWSSLTDNQIITLLDYDSRVLGIEIFNGTPTITGQDVDTHVESDQWDRILLTGRQCFGFAVPDHYAEGNPNTYQNPEQWCGRNILLVDDYTDRACLQAYRDGRFYSKLFDSDLSFDYIKYDSENHNILVSAPLADTIGITIDGVTTNYLSNSVDVIIPTNAVYVRVTATLHNYQWTQRNGETIMVPEQIFSNPIVLSSPENRRIKDADFIQLFIA